MTIDPVLLAAVIAAPDDDLIRLQVADWLDEHGQPARAEFVRVQVELAAKPWNVLRNPLNREYAALRRRERKLLLESPGQHRLSECPKGFGPCTGYIERPDGLQFAWLALNGPGEPVWFQFRRGFVSQITCTWTDWSAHAAAILAACPLRRVNRPKRAERHTATCLCPVGGLLENSGCFAGTVDDWRGDGLVRISDMVSLPSGSVSLRLLAERWRGVRFKPADGVSRLVREYTEGLSRYLTFAGGVGGITPFYPPVLRAETGP